MASNYTVTESDLIEFMVSEAEHVVLEDKPAQPASYASLHPWEVDVLLGVEPWGHPSRGKRS